MSDTIMESGRQRKDRIDSEMRALDTVRIWPAKNGMYINPERHDRKERAAVRQQTRKARAAAGGDK